MILLLGLLLLLCSCGVKAPPTPPVLIAPEALRDPQLKVREGRVFLLWKAPKRNVDGSRPAEVAKFRILRRKGCPRCPGEFKTVAEVEPEGRKSFLWEEREKLKVGVTYLYRIEGVNRWGFSGPPSPELSVLWRSPPDPPKGLKAEGGDGMVKLSWRSVEGASGYHLYRRSEDGRYGFDPLSPPVEGDTYVDKGLENGKTFCYVVRGVVLSQGVAIEGSSSQEVCATPEDITAPAAPTGLVAFKKDGEVELDWFPVEEEGVRYYVWRGRCGEELTRLTPSPIEETSFLDHPPEGGRCYKYAVSAVDSSPRRNEGPLSEAVKVEF